MIKINKTVTFTFAAIFAIFFVFSFYKTISRIYFQQDEIVTEKKDSNEPVEKNENISNENSGNIEPENQTEETQEAADSEFKQLEDEESADEETAVESEEEDEPYVDISEKDCQDRCKKYEDEEEFKYCQEFCGLSAKKEGADNCADLEGLEIDYCYKELAISKKDYSICEKIRDSGIQKICQSRITEDIIDSQKN